MDRVNLLRGQADDSVDSCLDSTSSQAYLTAEDESTFFSLSEAESSSQNASAVSAAEASNAVSDEFQLGKPIEASNILSGNVNIFDDNSCDGNELVIDDEVENPAESERSTSEPIGNPQVILSFDGVHVNAIDIGNDLYLFKCDTGQDEFAAVEISRPDLLKPTFKLLNVQETEEGNLVIYENIVKNEEDCSNKEKSNPEKSAQVPVSDLSKVLNENPGTVNKMEIGKINEPSSSVSKDVPGDLPQQNERKIKFGSEQRKSPLVGSYIPMSFHSTPNKERVPLTKTMVDLQLHPNKLPITSTKTIELNTDKQTINKTARREVSPISDISTDKRIENVNKVNLKKEDVKQPDVILVPEIDSNTVTKKIIKEEKEDTVTTKDNSNKDNVILPTSKNPEINDNLITVSEKTESLPKEHISKSLIFESPKDVSTSVSEKEVSNEVTSPLPQEDLRNTENILSSIRETCDVEHENNKKTDCNLEVKSDNEMNDELVIDLNEANDMKDKKETPTEIVLTINQINIEPKESTLQLKDDIKIEKEPRNNNLDQTFSGPEHNSPETEQISPETEQRSFKTEGASSDTKNKTPESKDELLETKPNVTDIDVAPLTATNKLADPKQTKSAEPVEQGDKSACNNNVAVPFGKWTEANRQAFLNKIKETKVTHTYNPNQIKQTNDLNRRDVLKKMGTVRQITKEPVTKPDLRIDSKTLVNETAALSKTTQHTSSNMQLTPAVDMQKDQFKHAADVQKERLTPAVDIKKERATPTVDLQKERVTPTVDMQKERVTPTVDMQKERVTPTVDLQKEQVTPTVDLQKERVTLAVDLQKERVTPAADMQKERVTPTVDMQKERVTPAADMQKQRLTPIVDMQNERFTSAVDMQKQLFIPAADIQKERFIPGVEMQNERITPVGTQNERFKPAVKMQNESLTPAIDVQKELFTPAADIHKESFTSAVEEQKERFTHVVTQNERCKPAVNIQKERLKPLVEMQKELFTSTVEMKKEQLTSTVDMQKERNRRTEMMNQDLIDKTIDGILKDKILTAKPDMDMKVSSNTVTGKSKVENSKASLNSSPPVLGDIKKKRIDLYEPPQTEKLQSTKLNQNIATCQIPDSATTSSMLPPPLNTTSTRTCNDKISDEDILEHAPVTGDTVSDSRLKHLKTSDSRIPHKIKEHILNKEKTSVITETEFEKFAKGNSVTCSDKITVVVGSNQTHKFQSVVETSVPKYTGNPTPVHKSAFYPVYGRNSLFRHNYPNMSSVPPEEAVGKNYSSNYQVTYQSPEKNHIEAPSLRFDDKPVKVVYIEGSNDFIPYNLNVQGQQLISSNREESVNNTHKLIDNATIDAVNNKQICSQSDKSEKGGSTDLDSTLSSCGSVDSNLNINMDPKPSEARIKTSHKRKQTLSSIKTPILELIEPKDVGIDTTNKRKKKIEDKNKTKIDDDDTMNSKNHVPKKSYLLGRKEKGTSPEKTDTSLLAHDNQKAPVVNEYLQLDQPGNTLDSLVKAAELLETQPDVVKNLVGVQSVDSDKSPSLKSPTLKRGRGRPRKYPLSDGTPVNKSPSPRKKSNKIDAGASTSARRESEKSDRGGNVGSVVNWTMGRINEKIVCPICNKLFRSEEVVYKHVQHCHANLSNGPVQNISRTLRSSREDNGRKIPEVEKPDSNDSVVGERINADNGNKTSRVGKVENKSQPRQRKSSSLPTILACDVCGKEFRQLTYLTKHKQLHENEKPRGDVADAEKSTTTCDKCGKKFRKLHHLVQHRLIHTQDNTRSQRKVSTDHSKSSALNMEQINKAKESSGFRCEQCDKSFRKLHHLVEHRETHKTSSAPVPTTTERKSSNTEKDTPQCTICNKTFRKLHHLIEHKETHSDNDKVDSNKSSLSAKDIIHECSLCYMVFPNEHSLNKHTIFCRRKKRASALKRAPKPGEEPVKKSTPEEIEEDIPVALLIANETVGRINDNPAGVMHVPQPEECQEIVKRAPKRSSEDNNLNLTREKSVTPSKVRKIQSPASDIKDPVKNNDLINDNRVAELVGDDVPNAKMGEKKDNAKTEPVNASVPKEAPLSITIDSDETSEDEDARYMLNPDYKNDFMRVRSNKRSSLQFDRPNKNDVKRRISLQHPPRVHRMSRVPKPKAAPAPRRSPSAASSSDESDIRYSFPPKPAQKEPKKIAATITKPPKKRPSVEHRCDCGELFMSQALLSRHHTVAHTPPRIRRQRSPPIALAVNSLRGNKKPTQPSFVPKSTRSKAK